MNLEIAQTGVTQEMLAQWQSIKDRLQPNPGGIHETLSTKEIALYELRNVFPPASPVLSSDEKRVYEQQKKLSLIDWLQTDFDRAMPEEAQKRQERKAEGKIQTYNVVLNVASWLLLEMDVLELPTEGAELRKKNWAAINAFDIQTNLRERFHVRDTSYNLQIQDDKIYSFLISREKPFEDILDDGVKYRKNEGSLEQDREEAEWKTFRDVIQPLLIDKRTSEETMCFYISPKGKDIHIRDPETGEEKIVPSNYCFNYVDVEKKKRNPLTGEHYIEVTRFASPLTDEEYEQIIVEKLDPEFATKNPHLSFAARCLGSPFVSPPGTYADQFALFESLFLYDPQAMRESEFKHIYAACTNAADGELNPRDLYLQTVRDTAESLLLHGYADWRKLSIRFNGILNIADKEYKTLQHAKNRHKTTEIYEHTWQPIVSQVVYRPYDVDNIGLQPVTTVSSGCGSNGGVELSLLDKLLNPFPTIVSLQNSVSQFGIDSFRLVSQFVGEDEYGSLNVKCPDCNKEHAREPGEWIYVCDKEKGGCGSTKISCGRKKPQ